MFLADKGAKSRSSQNVLHSRVTPREAEDKGAEAGLCVDLRRFVQLVITTSINESKQMSSGEEATTREKIRKAFNARFKKSSAIHDVVEGHVTNKVVFKRRVEGSSTQERWCVLDLSTAMRLFCVMFRTIPSYKRIARTLDREISSAFGGAITFDATMQDKNALFAAAFTEDQRKLIYNACQKARTRATHKSMCLKMTGKGRRCKGVPCKGSFYCFAHYEQHAPKRKRTQEEMEEEEKRKETRKKHLLQRFRERQEKMRETTVRYDSSSTDKSSEK